MQFPRRPLRLLNLFLLLALWASTSGCRKADSYPPIGLTLASPVDIALSDDEKYAFVLNADFDRTYNQGSIVTMDTDGNKYNAVLVPRMGRFLKVAGNFMLVGIDEQNDDTDTDSPPQIMLFDISNPQAPSLVQTWPIGCGPFNATMVKGYNFFAVSCLDGSLLIGDTENPTQPTLKYVRTYGQPRRALYLDTKRDLLFMFTTDTTKGLNADQELMDTSAFAQNTVQEIVDTTKSAVDASNNPIVPGYHIPNEVPDLYEDTLRAQEGDGSVREVYQFVIYDIAHEKFVNPGPPAAVVPFGTVPPRTINDPNGCQPTATEDCHFPFRDTSQDPYTFDERRWIYFRLTNFDGTPDKSLYYNNAAFRYYRTNFFAAQPDPDDTNAFYLSQRGSPDRSPFANQIIHVKINSAPQTFASQGAVNAVSYDNSLLNKWTPNTDSILSFERVYGFRGAEALRQDYPGSFAVKDIHGKKVVVVNNFRDLVNWVKNDWYFSISAQSLDDHAAWFDEQVGNINPQSPDTYYQFVVTSTGRVMTCLFYGDGVMLMDIDPGVGINIVNRIE